MCSPSQNSQIRFKRITYISYLYLFYYTSVFFTIGGFKEWQKTIDLNHQPIMTLKVLIKNMILQKYVEICKNNLLGNN